MTIIDDAINGARNLISDAVQRIRLVIGVNEFLLSAEVQKIRFSLHILISDRNQDGSPLDPLVAAQYLPDEDTLQLRPGFTLTTFLDKGTLLHELTHAAIDDMNLKASRGLHRTENESIAYIAQMLYRRYTHSLTADAFGLPQLQVANAIARNIAASPSLYTVTQEEIRLLRNTIGHRPIYRGIRGQLKVGDGIGLH
jgi:hypothetical protein